MTDGQQGAFGDGHDIAGARSSEDRIADVYLGTAGGAKQRQRARERIDWMFAERKGDSALDIGCSQGILPLLLARAGMNVTGVDINPHAIETARKLVDAEPEDVRDRVTLKVADACDPSFITGEFDTVYVGEVVEHLEQPELLIQAAAEKLREGGAFVLTTPHGFLPHDDHYQEFGLQELLDILPATLVVTSIDTSNGYIYLAATKDSASGDRPSAEQLLEITTKSLIDQQKFFYDALSARMQLVERLRSGNDPRVERLESEYESVKAIAIRRKKELEAADLELKKVTRIALRRRNELADMTETAAKREQEIRSLNAQRMSLEKEIRLIRSSVSGLEQEIQRKNRVEEVLRSRVDLKKSEIDTIAKSSIYQTGLAIRLAFKKPFPNLFRLPLRLIKLALGKRLALADPYRKKILESASANRSPATRSPTRAAQAPAVLSVTQRVKQFRDAGDIEGEFHYIQEEAEKRPTEGILRGLYWASIKSERFETAFEAIKRLEEFIGPSPTAEQTKRLDQLRRGPGMNLATLAAIPSRGVTPFIPERGRIAYVLHNSLPHSSGGYATRAHGLMSAVKELGFDPVCVTRPGYPLDLKPDIEPSEVAPEDEIDTIRYIRLLEPAYQSGTGLTKYTQDAAAALVKIFTEERPACVIAASAYRSALPALIAARSLGLPFIYEVRGFWEVTRISREPEYEKTAGFKVIRKIESEVAKSADHVLTLTTPMKEELTARGVPEDRIALVPNSCDIEKFEPRGRDAALAAKLSIPDDVPVIGYIGTFVQYEGLEHLAEACVRLKERGVEFRLLLVGNENASGTDRGSITEEINRIANEHGLDDWLIMPGRVPHEEVSAYYSLIDIAPFPRKPQPVTEMVSPMKPLEAMAMEKAVIVSSVKALAEMVDDGETGMIFEKGNIGSLTDSLALLIDRPDLRSKLGRAGRKWVENERTWRKAAKTVKQIVEEISAAPAANADDSQGNGVSNIELCAEDRRCFSAVKERFQERDAKLGKRLYSPDDWKRVEIALSVSESARRYGDIGIGQGQLINCLAERANAETVLGIDFRRHSKLLEPKNRDVFKFLEWDITNKPEFQTPPLDIVFAMEVFEHIEPHLLPAAVDHVRSLARDGTMFISVPYKEQEPLYHHDKPGGHKQSFDDAKMEAIFGPKLIWTDYREKWFLAFSCDTLDSYGSKPLDEFLATVRAILGKNLKMDASAA